MLDFWITTVFFTKNINDSDNQPETRRLSELLQALWTTRWYRVKDTNELLSTIHADSLICLTGTEPRHKIAVSDELAENEAEQY